MKEKFETTAYLVLSVRDLRLALKAARASQRASRSTTTHCVVFNDLTVRWVIDEYQISSVDFTSRTETISKNAEFRESLNKKICGKQGKKV